MQIFAKDWPSGRKITPPDVNTDCSLLRVYFFQSGIQLSRLLMLPCSFQSG